MKFYTFIVHCTPHFVNDSSHPQPNQTLNQMTELTIALTAKTGTIYAM
jgi:hypothetical protein